jgi:malate dehydrogenase (oxaloacetate-decarboxylating)(NADP+)
VAERPWEFDSPLSHSAPATLSATLRRMIERPAPGFRYRKDEKGETYLEVSVRGERLIEMPAFNKGTAFTDEERDALGLRGLLPPRVVSMPQQADRVMWTYEHQETDLERYLHLMGVLDRNETLFYRILLDGLEDLLPIVYTPTVGQACQNFGRIFRRTRGVYLMPEDAGRVDEILSRWGFPDVRVAVVTDGERVLGLGDLGAGGMGISIGKTSLYVAGAGIHPAQVLPVCLDVGTDNAALRKDSLYLGANRARVRGAAYEALVEAFLEGMAKRFPKAMVQFEDFASPNALRLLERHRDRFCCFNDDVQGTGAVARAGVLAGLRAGGRKLSEARILVAGAGSAGIGIARALAEAQVWLVDDKGLLTADRTDLSPYQRPLARAEPRGTLAEVAARVRPHVLIGVTGVAGLFTREVVGAMEGPRPLVFPLSNPTANSECTPGEARAWSNGRAIVATGSPFPATPQCNNVYVFPGVGLGVLVAEATRVTDRMLSAAADTLAGMALGETLFPPLRQIRRASAKIAAAVARAAIQDGVARMKDEKQVETRVQDSVWEPRYVTYRPASGK